MVSMALNRMSSHRTRSEISGSTTRKLAAREQTSDGEHQPDATASTSRKLYGLRAAVRTNLCS